MCDNASDVNQTWAKESGGLSDEQYQEAVSFFASKEKKIDALTGMLKALTDKVAEIPDEFNIGDS